MTDKQIINGVDVSGCKESRYYDNTYHCDLCHTEKTCKDFPNCYYKQLKRKEQECEYLKNCLDKSFKMQADSELWWEKERKDLKTKLDQLKAENEELKEKFKKFFNIDNQECWDVAFLNNEKERYK